MSPNLEALRAGRAAADERRRLRNQYMTGEAKRTMAVEAEAFQVMRVARERYGVGSQEYRRAQAAQLKAFADIPDPRTFTWLDPANPTTTEHHDS